MEKSKPANVHENHRERMREKCRREGTAHLEDHELIEMLLYYCVPRRDTNSMAHRIQNEVRFLSVLASVDIDELIRKFGMSENTAVFFALIGEFMRRMAKEKLSDRKVFDTTELAGEYAVSLLVYEKIEKVYVICLDSRKRITNTKCIASGNAECSYIHPKQIAEAAILGNSNSIILIHNHPNGDIKPTLQDINTTNEVVLAMNPIGVKLEDHIIVSDKMYYSFLENGLLNKQKGLDI